MTNTATQGGRDMPRNLVLTPDIAYAAALDQVYGRAGNPRHWQSADEREDSFWLHLRELLGNPQDDELREMLWRHREAIGRMNHQVVAHSLHGFAVTEYAVQPVAEMPFQEELPL